jgi:hypothetical protein
MRDHAGSVRKLLPWACAIALTLPAVTTAETSASLAASSRFDALRSVIASGRVRSVEELLPLLSPALRSRYVLIFDSRSVQEASRANPRVLLVGFEAKFIVSFNGDDHQHGFDAIETMEFDTASSSFVFREIRFPDRTAAADADVEFSPANPARCATCHGTPAHPIWDSFPLWPGVYGERYQKDLSRTESDGLAEFARAQRTHPRYRYLEGFDLERLREQLAPSQQRRYSGTLEEPPSAVLSAWLGRLTVSMIRHEVEASPLFSDYRYALLWSLHRGCGTPAEAVPAAVQSSFSPAFAAFADAVLAGDRLQALHKAQRAGEHADSVAAARPDDALDGFRYLAEQGLGLSTRHWTLALEQGNHDLTMQLPLASQLEDRLVASAASVDPQLPELRQAAAVSSDTKYCARLRRLSFEAFDHRPSAGTIEVSRTVAPGSADAASLRVLPSIAGRPNGLERCIACHVSSPVGPPIPFDDAALLSAQLRARVSAHGRLLDEILFRLSPQAGNHRMPLDATLSNEEEAQLRRYFLSLALRPSP